MFKKISENKLSRMLFQSGIIYAGLSFLSQLLLVVTAMYAPYVIGVLLIIIAILNVKLNDLSN
jgi:hypothetical protein